MVSVEKQLNIFRKQDRIQRGLFFAVSCLLVAALLIGFRLSTDLETGLKQVLVPPPSWLEETYLDANPDVAGKFESGWQHYLMHGKEENRAGVTLAQ
jgi:hypothetical protein